jgi:hypothetical protein
VSRDDSVCRTVGWMLIAVDTGVVAPPNTPISTSNYTAPQAGQQWGVASFSMPTSGWPAGQYRVNVVKTTGPVGSVSFMVQ